MATVYVETTIASYMTARPSGDVVLAAHQAMDTHAVTVGDSGVTIRVRMKTLPLKQWDMAHGLRRRVKESFEDQGIEIPVVQPARRRKVT